MDLPDISTGIGIEIFIQILKIKKNDKKKTKKTLAAKYTSWTCNYAALF